MTCVMACAEDSNRWIIGRVLQYSYKGKEGNLHNRAAIRLLTYPALAVTVMLVCSVYGILKIAKQMSMQL